jgi:hypothetical protein
MRHGPRVLFKGLPDRHHQVGGLVLPVGVAALLLGEDPRRGEVALRAEHVEGVGPYPESL